MLHLRYRAKRCNATLSRDVLLHDSSTIFARLIDYKLAIQNEPERMLDASIRVILASPPPPGFSRLWAEELEILTRHTFSSKETK
jgi:hypothetical protein